MHWRLATIAAVAALAAGCGGGGKSASDAAAVVPQDALAFVTIDTDAGSSQLSSASQTLDKFPFKPQLLQALRSGLTKQGINVGELASSAGSQLDIAVLRVNGALGPVGFAQPSDEKTFDAQLDGTSTPTPHETIDGWTVFADKQAYIDAVKNRTGNLSDTSDYQAALATVTTPAIASGYITGAGLAGVGSQALKSLPTGTGGLSVSSNTKTRWVAVALSSSDGGLKLEAHAKSSIGSTTSAAPSLAGQIPAGALVALSVEGGTTSSVPAGLGKQLGVLPKSVGSVITPILAVLNGPVIAYVRAGRPLPEVTIAAKPKNPLAALAAIKRLVLQSTHGQAKPVQTKVAGGILDKVDLGSFSIYYGPFSGEIVVSDGPNALAELNGSVGRLSDDALFKEAKDAAGLTDTNDGFLYIDAKDLLPTLQGIAQLASTTLPPAVEENLKPFRTVLVYAARDGDVETAVASLQTN